MFVQVKKTKTKCASFLNDFLFGFATMPKRRQRRDDTANETENAMGNLKLVWNEREKNAQCWHIAEVPLRNNVTVVTKRMGNYSAG